MISIISRTPRSYKIMPANTMSLNVSLNLRSYSKDLNKCMLINHIMLSYIQIGLRAAKQLESECKILNAFYLLINRHISNIRDILDCRIKSNIMFKNKIYRVLITLYLLFSVIVYCCIIAFPRSKRCFQSS